MNVNNRIAGFDGLRAIAVLMVFFQHRVFGDVSEIGHLGVWIFFALSGFLIIGILSAQRTRIERDGIRIAVELKRFLWRRTLRILPIYYLMLTVMCVLMVVRIASPEFAGGMPFHFAYLSNIWIGSVLRSWPGYYSHLWSLAIEEQFYLVVAPLLLLIAARGHRWVCGAIVVVGLGGLLWMRAAQWPEITIHTHPLTNFWLLALGGIGGLAITTDRSRLRVFLGHDFVVPGIAVCLVGLCTAEPVWARLASPVLFMLVSATYGVSIVALVCAIACCRNALVIKVLEARWLAGFGRISYGFYLYHNLIPDLTRNRHAEAYFGGAVPYWAHAAGVMASFGISLGIAMVSWRWIEKPILRLRSSMVRVDTTSSQRQLRVVSDAV